MQKRGFYTLIVIIILLIVISNFKIVKAFLDKDNDGEPDSEDCAPNDPYMNSYVDEICNDGIDNDCDLRIDNEDKDCKFKFQSTTTTIESVIEETSNNNLLDNIKTPLSENTQDLENQQTSNNKDNSIPEINQQENVNNKEKRINSIEKPKKDGNKILYMGIATIMMIIIITVIVGYKYLHRDNVKPVQNNKYTQQVQQIPTSRHDILKNFIETSIKQGYSKEQLTSGLLQKGWEEQEIQQVFSELGL